MDLGVMGVSDPVLLQNVLEGYPATAFRREVLGQLLPFYVFLRRLAAAEWNLGLKATDRCRLFLHLIEENPFPAT